MYYAWLSYTYEDEWGFVSSLQIVHMEHTRLLVSLKKEVVRHPRFSALSISSCR